jgi:hypothetical protein
LRRSLPGLLARARWRLLRFLWLARGAELRERRGLGVLHLQRAVQARATRLFLALDLLRRLDLHVQRREDGHGVELDASSIAANSSKASRLYS